MSTEKKAEKKETKRRIYLVTNPNRSSPPSLVRAGTKQQAIDHVARHGFAARVAEQDDLIKHLGDGVKVIDATKGDE